MKLTGEQRDDLLGEVAAYADAYAYGSLRYRSECLACIVAVVEKLMTGACEAGKADQRAQKDCDTCPDCGAEGLSSCVC